MVRAPRARSRLRSAALALAALAAGACSGTTSSDPVIPATGVLVKAESVVGSKGCGRGATEILKYVAVAVDSAGNGLAGTVYDCFADAQFDLLPVNEFAVVVDLQVFAYSAAAFEAQEPIIAAAGFNVAALKQDTRPTWTTKCRAIQQADIQVLARCDRLAAGLGDPATPAQAVIALPTQSFAQPGGAPLECGKDFASVRVRYGTEGSFAETGDVTCPTPVSITVPAPAAYTLDVALFSAAGAPVALRACSATTSPGLAASAVCD
ncbi:MAG: hypothetical protein KC657_32350 [Myxococcales bacterium]|nr:hypothetical protein [Myxococcales bacterium]